MINKSVWVPVMFVVLVGSSGCVVRNTIKGGGGLFSEASDAAPGNRVYFNQANRVGK